MNLANLLIDAADNAPDAPALARGTEVTADFAAHARRSARIAGALRNELGLAPGDRVALLMQNDPSYSEIMFGIWQAGCAAVPINARLHSREAAWILENCGARICFTDSDQIENLSAALENGNSPDKILAVGSSDYEDLLNAAALPVTDVNEDDLAWLFYTSGTTGRPKGAMLSHRNLRAMNRAYLASVDEINPGDSIIHAAPMSHGSGLYLLPHVERRAVQVIPESGGFDLEEFPLLLERWSGITMFMAPTMVTRLVNRVEADGLDAGSIKSIIYGGAPMYLEDCLRSLDILGNKLI
ncbi:MAG: AMP-binding protein, partial [Methyloligellaceae bacterium]